jgi:hypothetical protein
MTACPRRVPRGGQSDIPWGPAGGARFNETATRHACAGRSPVGPLGLGGLHLCSYRYSMAETPPLDTQKIYVGWSRHWVVVWLWFLS